MLSVAVNVNSQTHVKKIINAEIVKKHAESVHL